MLLNALKRRRAKTLGIKLSRAELIDSRSVLRLEAPAKLGSVQVLKEAPELIRIGAHSYIRSGELHFVTEIGRFCSFGRQVTIGQDGRGHPLDWASTSHELCVSHRPNPGLTRIGHDVWIGDGAVVMAGVSIGTGAIIARNAVVTKDVPPYQIVGGNPARPIRPRFGSELSEALLNSAWWQYPLTELRALDYEHPQRFLEQLADLAPQRATYAVIDVGRGKVGISGD
ncbi:CatB-related O-acetyltransferase [Marinobacterium sp. D7]|uniref:CatB-related O-acetyltransferase n=1 Tax=Marinobacterium ramblicola TaxID=2849041 RepID=UPI001C2DE67E|nr:CatB-related O-acetyltransferase [Marinobacterium ramblicola]MBV1788362.1 CatB-related O-acetyltransferase [Marinobacterium ramblicola]